MVNPIPLYKKALCIWGYETQVDMVIEEMAELTKAILKDRRKPSMLTRYDIIEEIADVRIMLEQLTEMIPEGKLLIALKRDEKLERLAKRLQQE